MSAGEVRGAPGGRARVKPTGNGIGGEEVADTGKKTVAVARTSASHDDRLVGCGYMGSLRRRYYRFTTPSAFGGGGLEGIAQGFGGGADCQSWSA